MRSLLWSALCVACLAACGDDGGGAVSFTLVGKDQPSALLSAWGASPSDMWVVGGAPDAASGPTVLRLDGDAWTHLDTGQTGIDLWWVFGFAGGDVFLSGSSGAILRYRDGSFERMPTPSSTGIVFGLWGATPDDVWAVGRSSTGGGALLWHFDGATWATVAAPSELPASSIAFKVSGRSSDDVWISCSNAGTLHWTGTSFEYLPIGGLASLFSIAVTPSDVVAAGSPTTGGAGALYENSGASWETASLAVPITWHGVGAGADQVYAVGDSGVIGHRDASGVWDVLDQSLIQRSFHASWVDDEGGFWGVGGEFASSPLTAGFLLYRGTRHVPHFDGE
ncbi:MAG TPA: hypothetical protein VGM90_18390 [Kofleriaceae bacterium]|jgi:hypothetical protein